jgi:hypothetical protein
MKQVMSFVPPSRQQNNFNIHLKVQKSGADKLGVGG